MMAVPSWSIATSRKFSSSKFEYEGEKMLRHDVVLNNGL
jgi:hypothetical protein